MLAYWCGLAGSAVGIYHLLNTNRRFLIALIEFGAMHPTIFFNFLEKSELAKLVKCLGYSSGGALHYALPKSKVVELLIPIVNTGLEYHFSNIWVREGGDSKAGGKLKFSPSMMSYFESFSGSWSWELVARERFSFEWKAFQLIGIDLCISDPWIMASLTIMPSSLPSQALGGHWEVRLVALPSWSMFGYVPKPPSVLTYLRWSVPKI